MNITVVKKKKWFTFENNWNPEFQPNRGFSSIEVWSVGMQIPILMAIMEYGFLLTMKKYCPGKNDETSMKFMDLCTSILSTIYLIVFNILYWFSPMKTDLWIKYSQHFIISTFLLNILSWNFPRLIKRIVWSHYLSWTYCTKIVSRFFCFALQKIQI